MGHAASAERPLDPLCADIRLTTNQNRTHQTTHAGTYENSFGRADFPLNHEHLRQPDDLSHLYVHPALPSCNPLLRN